MVGVFQLALCDNVEGTRKECSIEYLLDRIDCVNSIQPQHTQKSSGLPLSRQTESIDPSRGPFPQPPPSTRPRRSLTLA